MMGVRSFAKVVLFFILLISPSLWAKMDFLPGVAFSDPDRFHEGMRQIIPWAGSTSELIEKQKYIQADLRTIPDYMRWAEEKPGPYIVKIDKLHRVAMSAPVLRREVFSEIFESLNNRDYFEVLVPGSRDTLDSTLDSLADGIERNLNEGADLAQGIIIGIANTQDEAMKRAIFSAGGPRNQLAFLRANAIDETALLAKFNVQRAGLNMTEVTFVALLDQIAKSLDLQRDILADLTLAAAILEQGFNRETIVKVRDYLTRGNQELFDFLMTDSRISFGETLERLQPWIHLRSDVFSKRLSNVRKNFEADLFVVGHREKTQTTPYITLYEVHPYIGIFRGCIGGDCSTTSSWPYPNSPFEHVFIVYEKDRPVGYMSATRLITETGPTLYVKDLTGKQLPDAVAEAVINSLHHLAPYYNVNLVTFSSSSFTAAENHVPSQIALYAKYDERRPGFSASDRRTNTFMDALLRDRIGRVTGATQQYDSPAKHRTSVRFDPNPSIANHLQVTIAPGTLQVIQPKSTKDALLTALQQLSVDSETNILGIQGVNVVEAKNLSGMLANPGRLSLSDYHQMISEALSQFDIRLSRNFRSSNEELFWRGQLNSIDAFSDDLDPELLKENIKFLVGAIRRSRDTRWIYSVVQLWHPKLDRTPEFKELMDLMVNRGQPRDFDRIVTLMAAGSKVAAEAFAADAMLNMRENYLARVVAGIEVPYLNYFANSHDAISRLNNAKNLTDPIAARDQIETIYREFKLADELVNEDLQIWFDQFSVFTQLERIENVELLDRIIQSCLVSKAISHQACAQFIAYQQAWDRSNLRTTWANHFEDNLDEEQNIIIRWFFTEMGSRDEYLEEDRDMFPKLLETSFTQGHPDVPPFLRGYSPEIQHRFAHLQNQVFQFNGEWPQLFRDIGLTFDDFLQRPNLRNHLLNFPTNFNEGRMFIELMLFNELYRNTYFNMVRDNFLTLPWHDPRVTTRFIETLARVFNGGDDIPGMEEFKEEIRVRFMGVKDRANWWNTAFLQLIRGNAFTEAELQTSNRESMVPATQSDPHTLVLALARDIENGNGVRLSPAQLRLIATNLDNSDEDAVPEEALTYSRLTAQMFAQFQIIDEEILNELESSALDEDDLATQMWAMVALDRNGQEISLDMVLALNETLAESELESIDRDLLRIFTNELFSPINIDEKITELRNPQCQDVTNVHRR